MVVRQLMKMVNALLAVMAGSAMLAMVLLTFVDVVGRYGFHASVFGASEMIEWLMVVVIFGGIALVTKEDAHITVGLFDGFLLRRVPVVSRWSRHVFTLAFYSLMVWILWRLTLSGLESARSSAVLGIPLWAFSGAGAMISTLGLAGFAADLLQKGGRLGRHEHTASARDVG